MSAAGAHSSKYGNPGPDICLNHNNQQSGKFYLRVKAGQPRNIKRQETLVLQNIFLMETLFLKY